MSLYHKFKNGLIPQSYLESLKPLLFIAYLCGLTPFRIVNGQRGPKLIKDTVMGFLIPAFYCVTYLMCYVYTAIKHESVIGYFLKTEVTRFGSIIQAVSGIVGATIVQISATYNKWLLLKVFEYNVRIDDRFRRVGSDYNYSQVLRALTFNLGVFIFINGLFTFGFFYLLRRMDVYPSFCLCGTFFMQLNGLAIGVCIFKSLIEAIQKRLDLLNGVLKNLSNQWENRKIRSVSAKSRSINCLDSFSMYTIVTKNPCEIIHESMEIHHLICEAASTANKYFTYQLLTIISIAFLIIVFDAYYVLETLLGKSKRESKFKTVEFVTFFSCQMILYLIAIISIVEGSNRAIKKSEKTGGIIHGLLNKAKNPDVKEKLQQFSMQLMHLKINFTAAGLFNIDRTLYFTISGALTTYLIILLQFTSSTPNGSAPCSFGPGPNATSSIETH
ncbi:putative gustatory receptor 28b isoform X2 [Episyrphus balteatus]|uniref:putative gustatory receptor 28b isoform X2 n=1 Tax=Episyrphus balteatus TaxID=286459 RepID=UPI002485E9F2|nr:putative gustatory receptor 28b isoform X2 [Episyrphus balteatus]